MLFCELARATSRQPAWMLPALAAVAALFLLGLFSTELADPDAWWHLAPGRYIVPPHPLPRAPYLVPPPRLPFPAPFAYTTALVPPANAAEASTERFNLTHEWLAQA